MKAHRQSASVKHPAGLRGFSQRTGSVNGSPSQDGTIPDPSPPMPHDGPSHPITRSSVVPKHLLSPCSSSSTRIGSKALHAGCGDGEPAKALGTGEGPTVADRLGGTVCGGIVAEIGFGALGPPPVVQPIKSAATTQLRAHRLGARPSYRPGPVARGWTRRRASGVALTNEVLGRWSQRRRVRRSRRSASWGPPARTRQEPGTPGKSPPRGHRSDRSPRHGSLLAAAP
jgi:hypothetical protein